MSNRKRSKADIAIRRFGKMADNYQEKINAQKAAIDRLMNALFIAQGGLHMIQTESRDIRAARKLADETAKQINAALESEEQSA